MQDIVKEYEMDEMRKIHVHSELLLFFTWNIAIVSSVVGKMEEMKNTNLLLEMPQKSPLKTSENERW